MSARTEKALIEKTVRGVSSFQFFHFSLFAKNVSSFSIF